jgi:hypothetical protein
MADKGWAFRWGVGQGPANLYHKSQACYKMLHKALDLDGNELSGSIKGREFLSSLSVLLSSQEGLYSMELIRWAVCLVSSFFNASSLPFPLAASILIFVVTCSVYI